MTGIFGWLAHSGVVQGVIIGATLAFLSAVVIMNAAIRTLTTVDNGWHAIRRCGRPGNGVLVRAACAKALPGVNVFEEAAYWTTMRDAANRALRGTQDYVLHVEPGGLPPHDAFWSLTVTDVVGYMMPGATDRSSIDDRTPLALNADGSIDIHLRRTAPAEREQNWLPIPAGRFKLMLRVYLPGAAILDGTYRLPRITRVHEAEVAR